MNDEIFVNAEGIILGRLCTFVAKKALMGYNVNVVNIEKAIVTGNKKIVFGKYKRLREIGGPRFGITIVRTPRGIFKRALINMLPHKNARGRQAMERVKAFRGLPESLKDKKLVIVQGASVEKVPNTKYVSVLDIVKFIGGK
ncbi:50S ribosomal protein L13 [Candidatus Woesearchaeota archaeon]|nr:50S ribosomal protein L13 [Candidatus Woesearchaeota archaeon]